MYSINKIIKATVPFIAAIGVSAVPFDALDRLALAKRQESNASGLSDFDILQFALTLEHLEAAFYQQGFNQFEDSQFEALGLSQNSIDALKQVGETEAIHVTFLEGALTDAGQTPVEPCQYKFGFTDAATMINTASILEAVGVSAYLGAAPLIKDKGILSTAASIATIEARHQTFIRVAGSKDPIPGAFDNSLGPRAVFTLASPFIESCPEGSNLGIKPFPSITVPEGTEAVAGSKITLQAEEGEDHPSFCAFVTQGKTIFEPLEADGCVIPSIASGESYVFLTSAKTTCDAAIVAGPAILQLS